jgi:glucokinase
MDTKSVFIGTDSGATTSKVGAVWADASPVSTDLIQRPTESHRGPEAVVGNWVEAIDRFLAKHHLTWDQVSGVGLATPGPFQSYGVLGHTANMPDSFRGFDVHTTYSRALAKRAGRPVPLTVGNDGDMGGVAEAQQVRGDSRATVVLLAPGSGLGTAYIGRDGLPLTGDTLSGMEGGHMPAVLHELNIPPYPCGCGRTWGCIEVYTTISGLPHLLGEWLPRFPDHALHRSPLGPKERAMSLRGLAQKGDPMANEIFDFQAKALGLHVANLAMALDPEYVVIGGGLMDPGATTDAFRARYLGIVRDTARPRLWPPQREKLKVLPAVLGDLSQAIGAAQASLYQSRA